MKTNLKNYPIYILNLQPDDEYIERCEQWKYDFEAELRSRIEKQDKWLMDVKNQLPCQPMTDYNWQYHAELYWEQLWNMLDTLKEVLGDG